TGATLDFGLQPAIGATKRSANVKQTIPCEKFQDFIVAPYDANQARENCGLKGTINNFTRLSAGQRFQHASQIDVLANELHGAVRHQEVTATWVIAAKAH